MMSGPLFLPFLKRKIIPEEDDMEEQSAKKGPASTGFPQTRAELLATQVQLASTTARLTAELRQRENLRLNAGVLAGKTALAAAQDESSELRRVLACEREGVEIRARMGERLLREPKDDLEECEGKLAKVRKELEGAVNGEVGMQERCRVLEGRVERLAGEVAQLQAEKAAWAVERAGWEVERKAWEVEKRRGEEERRSLHGTMMELKGNIRVFCRVRPVLSDEEAGAEIAYPDAGLPYPSGQKKIVLSSTAAEREWDAGMGNKARREVWSFAFDRVFTPDSTQADLFAEISQLVQSCTDGYNVCIFAYGQTGSGKSWTMEGGGTEETQGMIPRAVAQVFRVAEELKDQGWTYTMEGQFLEIYNDTITDLLSPPLAAGDPPRKHEIHHHPTTPLTSVSGVLTPALTSPAQVSALLAQAQGRRRIAATLMNERSSRSHLVFTLRIRGVQDGASGGEGVRVGTLNLVDLAGSERLATLGHGLGARAGGAWDKRLKETQSINRSLSALRDVVAALGTGPGAHVPCRNSTLTYLLQPSFSGNSKTLMVLNLSPRAADLSDSLTSLRFATRVNDTTIGTAKKVQVQSGNA